MMKELSIEVKAKAYDEALEKAKIWQKHLYDVNDKDYADELNYIFPELKESEDEKIRKAIYNCVKWFGFDSCFFKDVSQEECLAWLEKKAEQNPAWSEEDEKILSNIIKDLVHPWNEYIPDRIEDEIKWLKNILKSLRPQPQWKPSDEQISILWDVLCTLKHENYKYLEIVKSLYQDLKKLK